MLYSLLPFVDSSFQVFKDCNAKKKKETNVTTRSRDGDRETEREKLPSRSSTRSCE